MRGVLPTLLSGFVLVLAAVFGSGVAFSSPTPARHSVARPRAAIEATLSPDALPFLVCSTEPWSALPKAESSLADVPPSLTIDAPFWAGYDGSNGLDDPMTYAGLPFAGKGTGHWTTSTMSGCNDYRGAVERSFVDLLLGGHEVLDVALKPDGVLVRVDASAGSQTVQVALPLGISRTASFQFVDASGHLLARIDGAGGASQTP